MLLDFHLRASILATLSLCGGGQSGQLTDLEGGWDRVTGFEGGGVGGGRDPKSNVSIFQISRGWHL